jgi:hypothetical protein
MSVKLNELVIKPKDGKLVIGKPNKRGHLQSYIDIGTPVVKCVLKMLTSKSNEFIHHTEIDPDTKEVKHYKITCHEMTKEEVENLERNKIREREKAQKEGRALMGTLFSMMLGGFGSNNLRLK